VTVAAIILAAGASRRMGSPKPLLPWAGTTLLQHELDTLQDTSVERIVVVLGARSELVRRTQGPLGPWVYNARWPLGRSTSLARGAAALMRGPAPEAIVIQNVDQPTRAEVIERLLDALRATGADAVQPVYVDAAGREHGGHPVVIRGTLLAALTAATEATEGLRGVLAGRDVRRVEIHDPTVGLDLDTPEAYETARAALGA